ncbi:MAG: porphobilinogen synthase [bacterium]
MRRLRRSEGLRRLVRETRVAPADLIQPLFVVGGTDVDRPIPSLPGQRHVSADVAAALAAEAQARGVGGMLLFGLPDSKDEQGSSAWDDDGPVQSAIRAIRSQAPGLPVLTDVCLCQYTSHGACGVLHDGEVDNDATLPLLAKVALSHARAGADAVAPSDMMDGRVGAIRRSLDGEGLEETAIVAYSSKFASAFYGPFRDAAGSAPKDGDRKGYQLDPANAREAVREALLDAAEGADALMVKPAMPYLDLIARVRDASPLPLAAYPVSGEYALLEAAAAVGSLDRRTAILESLTAIRRAGADLVITYWASEASEWLD